jgi:hypothetical protein
VASVKLPTQPAAEITINGGVRQKIGDIDFDLRATYFLYPGEIPVGVTNDIDYWEAGVRADKRITESIRVAAGFAYSPGGIECLQDHKEGLAFRPHRAGIATCPCVRRFLDRRYSLLVAFVLAHVGGVDLRQTDFGARFDNKFFSIVHPNLPLRCRLHPQLLDHQLDASDIPCSG